MNLKVLNPLHILFASLSLLLAILFYFVKNTTINFPFLLTANAILWILTSATLVMFIKSLQNKRPIASVNAVNGGVMLKLFVLGAFIPLYHFAIAPIGTASLLLSFLLYILYSALHVKTTMQINQSAK